MGRTTALTNAAVAVATSDTLVLAQNLGRREVTICNDGANVVYLTLGATAVVGTGVRLAAGASYTTNLWEGSIRGIAVTGATNVSVAEY